MNKTRLLIVEDESIIAEDIKACLLRFGYDVLDIISTGEEAIVVAENKLPNVVLMDIKLRGEMDGIAAAEIIRDKLDIPVVYLTSHSDDATLHRAKLTHPFGYILKPYEERELYSNIEMALYKHDTEVLLREREARFRSVVNAANDAIVTMDSKWNITGWNPAAENMFDYDDKEAIGENVSIFMPPRFFESFKQLAIGVSETGNKIKGRSTETVFKKKDGTEFEAEMSFTSWTLGGETFFTGIIRDISERKRVDAERQKTIMELQESLAEASVKEAESVDRG